MYKKTGKISIKIENYFCYRRSHSAQRKFVNAVSKTLAGRCGTLHDVTNSIVQNDSDISETLDNINVNNLQYIISC